MSKVAFLGMGVMGYPMAGHIAAAGHEVTVYNRTAAKSEAWAAQHGGAAALTPAAAAADADFVFCCVGDDPDVLSVALGDDGAIPAMKTGAVFIDNSTVSADVARQVYDAAKSLSIIVPFRPMSRVRFMMQPRPWVFTRLMRRYQVVRLVRKMAN